MSTLILPLAGQSTRFSGLRPKWLFTMPCGRPMFERSISKLNLSGVDSVVVICLREHLDKYTDFESLRGQFDSSLGRPVNWVVLDKPTRSQSETVAEGIKHANVVGSIFIKDCDNEFEYTPRGINEIAVLNLNQAGLVDAKSKSYVEINEYNQVTNIVEKNVISNEFCCGGYGFASAKRFFDTFERLNQSHDHEIYVSHVVYQMLVDGDEFAARSTASYVDWGTSREYNEFRNALLTVFCDIDGVLLEHGTGHGSEGWSTNPIKHNIESLIEVQKRGRIFLVLTSSRPAKQRDSCLGRLNELGLRADETLFGLPHTKRYLVSSYSDESPYPNAISINLEQNTEKLKKIFKRLE